MRDHSNHKEVSRNEAVALLLSHAHFTPAIEEVALTQACGRVLAQDALAQLDMPNCLTCRMDSVAIHWDDFAEGMPDTSTWKKGVNWEFANTGVGMPEGFDTAIVIEHVQLSDDLTSIAFDAAPSARFAGTSAAGSKMHAGDVLVSAGTLLTPLLVSHIAAGNNATAKVFARPKVAFIPTGNELVSVGSAIPRGKNIETNSLLIGAKIRQWGGDPLLWDIVPDNPESIKRAILDACAAADIVVVNAGSSKGSDDWNIEMLNEIGEVLYHQTNHGPGHHSSGSVVDGTVVVGISGPPGGAAFTTDFYVYPLMMKYLGQPTSLKQAVVRLAAAFPKGGPGSKPGAGGVGNKPGGVGNKPAPLRGEERPSVIEPGKEFFGIKQVRLSRAADGCLEATPASGVHLNPIEAEQMDAYFLMSSLHDAPAVGDLITVDLRPDVG